MRASILGPISSLSWKANVKFGQPVFARILCESFCRLMLQPQERIALSTCGALAVRHSISKHTRNWSEERTLFYAVSERSERDRIDTLKRVALRRAISHYATEFRNFCNPATVFLAVKFNYE